VKTKRRLLQMYVVLFITFFLVACSQNEDSENEPCKELSQEANASCDKKVAQKNNNDDKPTYLTEVTFRQICLDELPGSSNEQMFGNWFNNTNIVFHPGYEVYFFSQTNIINQFDVATVNELGFQMKIDRDMVSLTKISDNSFENLNYVNGRLFYTSNRKLMVYYNQTERVLVEQLVLNYWVDEDMLYYMVIVGEIRVRNINSNEPSIILPISPNASTFQVYDGKVFFLGDNGIYVYVDNQTILLYNAERVTDFLIDGVLVFRSNLINELRIAGRNRIVATGVTGYTIKGNLLYYSTWNGGLYTYCLNEGIITTLIYAIDNNKHLSIPGLSMVVYNIAVFNDKLFLGVWSSRFGLAPSSIVYGNLNGSNITPIVDITNPSFQTLTHLWQNYSISYPIGFVIVSDAGSFYGVYNILHDPKCNVLVKMCNWRAIGEEYIPFAFADLILEGEYGTVTTHQGYEGIYSVVINNGGFTFRFFLDGFTLLAEGGEEHLGFMMPILYEMMSSLEIH